MHKLTELTPEQAEQMPSWAEKWRDAALSCDEADWGLAESSIKECYKFSGSVGHVYGGTYSSTYLGKVGTQVRLGFREGFRGGFCEDFRVGFREGFRVDFREGFRDGFREGFREATGTQRMGKPLLKLLSSPLVQF